MSQGIAIWQIALLTLYAFFSINESLMLNLGFIRPVFAGAITGAIMGDLKLGLMVGGTMELMQLGISAFGGASIPDFFLGAVVGTTFGILAGKGVQFAIGVGVPVGLLMLQLDILARFANTALLHRVDKAVEAVAPRKIEMWTLMGSVFWGLSRALPVLIILSFGQPVVNTLLQIMPDWLMGGLKVAGGVLPVVGISILLRYLPTKDFVPELLVGFVLAAYLNVPILGVTLVGLAAAVYDFKKHGKDREAAAVTAPAATASDEGGFQGDE
ncbi:PTS mannose/fructose/sorbose/N-acetylgalactosamine transporter subunit IIC [Lacticaseibacillus absianus]|uniref:PTS mannose/fructose/sorbose/N-acetylgalactosamine transporter subunit IIC n=1 Tax=Lacticaseibacillus absianus TaxID=2729623 RepID=UPI0015C96DD3|nr:PTS sugar transporter subunit IIC [Lacticaseibacillus absianus]